MNRKEFLNEVERRLHGLPAEDISKALDYFGEMIDDRTEDGMSEEEAVAEIGTAQEAAEGILMELPFQALARFSRKCPWGSALNPPCKSALVREALTISIRRSCSVEISRMLTAPSPPFSFPAPELFPAGSVYGICLHRE